MTDSDLKELCAVLLYTKFYDGVHEEAIKKAFDVLHEIRDYDFQERSKRKRK